MLDYLWASMLILGVVWGLLNGKGAELTQAVLDGGKDAVTLSMTMLGVMSVWTGLMEVGKQGGLLGQVNRLLRPVISWLFPGLPRNHPAAESISLNFAANLLGMGNAATPAALKAMRELEALEEERAKSTAGKCGRTGTELRRRESGGRQTEQKTEQLAEPWAGQQTEQQIKRASDEMCTFLIINISSLQLIPINMIAYRSQYGAVNPASITVPVLIATCCSTAVGVIFCRLCGRKK